MSTFTGTAGDDSILGTAADDVFDLSQGGNDTAAGGAGGDVFSMGGTLAAGDRIDGGGGLDTVILDGDYSGLSLARHMLDGIERVVLDGGGPFYRIDNIRAVGADITFDGSGMDELIWLDATGDKHAVTMIGGGANDRLIGGDGGGELEGGDGSDTLTGGDGADRLVAGTGRDVLDGGLGFDTFEFGGDFTRGDHVIGGDALNALYLTGGTATPLVCGGGTLSGISVLSVSNGDYDITLNDRNLAAGAQMAITVGSGALRLDGSHETDGQFRMSGGTVSDTLIGGAGDDQIRGHAGDDTLIGGGGDDLLDGGAIGAAGDKLVGGLGADTLTGSLAGEVRFFFLDVGDSTAAAPDVITQLGEASVIWLRPIDADTTAAGNQAFHLVAALDGHAGELALSYDSGHDLTTIAGDINGDGVADLVITAAGDHAGFTNFVF